MNRKDLLLQKLRGTENPDNELLATLLEEGIIEMPKIGTEKETKEVKNNV